MTAASRRAQAHTVAATVEVRHCESLSDLQACVALQKDVWNFHDADLIPLRMFVVAKKIGGQVLGAFEGRELVAFALAIPGVRENLHRRSDGARKGTSQSSLPPILPVDFKTYLHSHMLAVRADHRNRGLGRTLKLAQREDALARGFDLMEWTFDPLEIKNSYFNLHRLGAIARRYSANQYGASSSPLQGGLPTDRLVAEWWLKSPRVEAAITGGGVESHTAERVIEVPAEIYTWKSSSTHRDKAAEVQARNRDLFLQAFAEGLAATGYQRDSHGNGRFLLTRVREEELTHGSE